MGFSFDRFVKFSDPADIFGTRAREAAEDAAAGQLDAANRAAELQFEATQLQREDLAPFRDAGVGALGDLQTDLQGIRNLVESPEAQRDFVTNNPFFDALAEDAQRRLFNNQAARGKVGSGGTAEALQNSILLLGNDLVNQNINQRQGVFQSGFDITRLGANAAAGQATAAGTGALNQANFLTQGANAQAAGIVGASNAQQAANQNLVNTGLGIASLVGISDRRFKDNIVHVNDIFYFFKYKGESKLNFGTMADKVPWAVIDMGGKKYVDYARI